MTMTPRASWLATCLAACAVLTLSDASRSAWAASLDSARDAVLSEVERTAQEAPPEGESQKRCGCPVMPEEHVLLPCQDPARPERCGSCTVVTSTGKRDGRPCVSLPYETPR